MTALPDLAGQSIDAARRILTATLKANSVDSPDLDARLLLGAALDLDLTGLIASANRTLTSEQALRARAFAARRITGEPVARILGHKEFWGLTFELSPATLVPRPDTETVVEAALEMLRDTGKSEIPIRIADIGTGSGAILLALLSELPQATGIGTDISRGALATATLNAERLGLAARASFVESNYGSALTGNFDLIVSNPPYIRSRDIDRLPLDVREHDPHLALDGGADGLDAYRAITSQAGRFLVTDGVLIFEVGHDQAADVGRILTTEGLTLQGRPRADLAGLDRAVIARKPAI